jgi:large subunit ribosomal protein L4
MSKGLTIPQFNIVGEKAEDYVVTAALPKVNSDLVAQACRVYLSNLRQGNASTKGKGAVRGGGCKPWKQKGTGRARQGSTRSPHWRHGGVAHGPHPTDYRLALPPKMADKALKMSLFDRLAHNRLAVMADYSSSKPLKTKEAATILAKIAPKGRLTLVLDLNQEQFLKATNNLVGVRSVLADSLNAYDVIAAPFLVLSASAANKWFKDN